MSANGARKHPTGAGGVTRISRKDDGAGSAGLNSEWRKLQRERARGGNEVVGRTKRVAGDAKPSAGKIGRVALLGPYGTFQDKRHDAEARYWDAEAAKSVLESQQLTLELSEYSAAVSEASSSNKRNRVYDFTGAITKTTAEECIEHVSRWARQNTKPITVVFNSPGGEIINGLALFDFLRAVDKFDAPITTVTYGMAASMGAILMQAGRERVAGPNSFFLIHEADGGAMGSVSEMQERADWVKQLNERLISLMAERSKLTASEIRRRGHKKDWTITAEQAVEYGFADRIGLR